MAAPAKPRHRSGYSREETEQVEAASSRTRSAASPETLPTPRRSAPGESPSSKVKQEKISMPSQPMPTVTSMIC